MYKYDNYKTVYIDMGDGIFPFSVTAVKKYLVEEDKEEENNGLVASEPTVTLPSVNEKVEVFWPKDEKNCYKHRQT